MAKSVAINEKPRESWTREEITFWDENLPSELRKELHDLDKEKLELYSQRTSRNKIIKDKMARVDELETQANNSKLLKERNTETGGFNYYEGKNPTKSRKNENPLRS